MIFIVIYNHCFLDFLRNLFSTLQNMKRVSGKMLHLVPSLYEWLNICVCSILCVYVVMSLGIFGSGRPAPVPWTQFENSGFRLRFQNSTLKRETDHGSILLSNTEVSLWLALRSPRSLAATSLRKTDRKERERYKKGAMRVRVRAAQQPHLQSYQADTEVLIVCPGCGRALWWWCKR